MSAAFALQPSGPPVPCSFPKCTLEAFHDGDHQFAPKKPQLLSGKQAEFPGPRYGHCVVCGQHFTVYGDHAQPFPSLCDDEACLAHYRQRMCGGEAPLLCCCPQRPYAHDLSTHKLLRSESYHPQRRFLYPWSLCSSERLELSTERD